MIISKTPYRIPLTGGGTDLDFYYKKRSGSFFSLAINQYVYVHLQQRNIESNYLIQTTKSEFAITINQIKHPIIRETLRYFKIKEKMHVGTYSTIPTNTGLGASSAMIVGLINCIKKYKKLKLRNNEIINKAYEIERKICKQYGGWQDQIISQVGGLIKVSISKSAELNIKKLKLNSNIINKVKNNFLLIYTQSKRNSSSVSLSVKKRSNKIIIYYDHIKSLNKKLLFAMRNKNPKFIADIFNQHWKYKKKLSYKISSNNINKLYLELLTKYNFLGGKLIGAGGGGFFLMITKNKKKTMQLLREDNIKFLDPKLVKQGSTIIMG